jgi:hypothetical protein
MVLLASIKEGRFLKLLMQGPRPGVSELQSVVGRGEDKGFPEAVDTRRCGGSRDQSEVPALVILVSLFADAPSPFPLFAQRANFAPQVL